MQVCRDSGESESTATLRLAPPDQGLPSPGTVGPATLALLPRPPTPPPESTTATDAPPATESRADTVAPPPVDTTSDEAPATWTVRPGDSFWRITGELLGSDGNHPSEEEFLRYWERLIEANRSELADPTNPDLLLPGQVLTIP